MKTARKANSHKRFRGRPRVRLRAVSALALLALASPALANADSASITVTNTAGESDPATGLARVFTVEGNVVAPERVFVDHRAVGGAPCAPSAKSDSGYVLPGDFAYDTSVNGNFKLQQVLTWEGTGPEMFCIWLTGNEDAIGTPITQLITFRAPSGTISGTVSPTVPTPGQATTLTVTGSSEVPAYVFATVRKAGGAGCAPSYDSENEASSVIYERSVNGSFGVPGSFSESSAGTYVACFWLATSGNSPAALAGPQAITFVVASPPPPPPNCIVPSFSTRMRLATVEHRIRAGHCRVGRLHYSHSRHVRRGDVIKLTPGPRSVHANRDAVTIVVSLGR